MSSKINFWPQVRLETMEKASPQLHAQGGALTVMASLRTAVVLSIVQTEKLILRGVILGYVYDTHTSKRHLQQTKCIR